MSLALIRVTGILGSRKWMWFGHVTSEVPEEIMMAWKADRTRDRDSETMNVKEIVWPNGTEVMEKGDSRKRSPEGPSTLGQKWFSGHQEKMVSGLFGVGVAGPVLHPEAWDIQLVEKNMVSPEIQRGGELEYSIFSVSHRNESAIRHFPPIFRPAGHRDWVFKASASGPQPHMHLRIIKGSFEKRWHQVPFQTIKMESLRNRSQVLIFF